MENQPPGAKKPPSNNLTEASGQPPEVELSNITPLAAADPKKTGHQAKNLLSLNNRYIFIFILLILTVGAITYIAINASKKTNPSSTAQSLTSQQLATLKGSTTIVGTSQETLDVQSSAIFEGSVLMRNNLDVAGTLKVGGSLSLPSITVGGNSSFGNTDVNGTLSVAGETTLESQVNLQKNLAVAGSGSFGSLSTAQLNVSSLQLAGDLTINRHIVVSAGVPSKDDGSALGGGGTASVSGTDTAGTVTINTGGGPPAGCFVTINFTQKFNSTPHVVISPSNSSSAGLAYYTNRSTSDFSVCDANAPNPSTTYLFDYIVID